MNPDDELEEHLRRYRPLGPPAGLRERALSPADAQPAASSTPRRLIAAGLLLWLGLEWATLRASARLTAAIGPAPVPLADELRLALGPDAPPVDLAALRPVRVGRTGRPWSSEELLEVR